jgi:hypothetical protein
MVKRLHGSCHCGAVELSIPWNGAFEKLRRCDCSFCSRRSAVVASVKLADLRIEKGSETLALYTFGTNTAQHYFCSVCGIYTHHQRRSDPTEYGVNIANFDGVDVKSFADVAFTDGVNHPSDR